MRILRTIRSINPTGGGPIEGIIQSSQLLSKLGHTVEIVSLDSPDAPWVKSIPIKIYTMGPGIGKYSYTPRYVSWLREHGGSYDVVIIHGLWQYSGFGAWRALRPSGTPFFVFPHGMLDPYFKRRYPLKHIKKWLYWPWAEYRVLRDARAVLFTSEQERLLARKSFWLYECREELVNYGTALPPQDKDNKREIFFKRFPQLRNKRIILFMGRIHPKKNCDSLIKSFSRIYKKAPFYLVMAGPDQTEWGTKLKKLCEKLNISDRITWTGMVSGDLKWGAFYASEAFILPSHQENFGMAVVEALGCGVPVLISDKVNIWREIEADGAGLVAGDSLQGSLELFEKWSVSTDNERKIMVEKARQCFLKRFEIHKAVGSLIDVLHANGVKG